MDTDWLIEDQWFGQAHDVTSLPESLNGGPGGSYPESQQWKAEAELPQFEVSLG